MTHRTILLVLACLVLALGPLACALPSSVGPSAEEMQLYLKQTVDAELAARALEAAVTSAAPISEPPTAIPPTVESSLTPTLTPTTPFTPTPTQTPIPTPCDAAQFVSDVTVADDSNILVNGQFTKTWRLRNVGTCTWTSGYHLVFDHGDQMSAPSAVTLTSGTVPPGSTVDVSVQLKAPGVIGTYQGFFKLRNGSGVLFGIGPDANGAFWVKIKTTALVPIMPIVPISPLYHSSGTNKELDVDKCFDLDEGGTAACSAGEADIKYIHNMLLGSVIDPLHGGRMSTTGHDTNPSKSTCMGEAMVTSPVDLGPYSFCYLTSSGRYGWLKVRGITDTILVFDWGTY